MSRTKRFWIIAFLGLAILVAAEAVVRGIGKQLARKQNTISVSRVDPLAAKGSIDAFTPDQSGQAYVNGWVLHEEAVVSAELIIDEERRLPVAIGVPRADVVAAFPTQRHAANSGFEGRYSLGLSAYGAHTLQIEMVLQNGNIARLSPQIFFNAPRNDSGLAKSDKSVEPFHFVMATSNLKAGGGAGIVEHFKGLESPGVRLGVMVPILYLRTTLGKDSDWIFDPSFDTNRKCGDRQIVEDNLTRTIEYALKEKVPVLFTLNGGVWADASCDDPFWDVNDALEAEKIHCQWNNSNEVMPDNYFASIPGTHGAPQIGRVMSYNAFNEKPRHYKRRNLQAAATIIAQFAQKNPELFLGINLDSDTYMNPFYEGKQWYDYNPNTLKQFRHWLRVDGPYAPGGPLAEYGRSKALSLRDVRALSGKEFPEWDDVDPPRTFSEKVNPYWENRWHETWEHFRRHVVDVHYDELSIWVAQTGISRNKIFSSQGFFPPRPPINPFALKIFSPIKNFDTGGMSVEGAVPSNGRLGAVLYGESSRNSVVTEDGRKLFAIFNAESPNWAVVEFHPGDQREPTRVPSNKESLQSLRAMMHGGAKFISVMAWNGGSGQFRDQPGFVALTTLRQTPLDYMLKHVMASHQDLPPGSRVWTFGSVAHSDDEDWVTSVGVGNSSYGQYLLKLDGDGRGEITTKLSANARFSGAAFDVSGAQGSAITVNYDSQNNKRVLLGSAKLESSLIEHHTFSSEKSLESDRLSIEVRGRPNQLVSIHRFSLHRAN